MKKLFALLLSASCSYKPIQQKLLIGDTIPTVLGITNSKLKSIQAVPGYVIIKDSCIVGYLTRNKKQFPKKVQIWSH